MLIIWGGDIGPRVRQTVTYMVERNARVLPDPHKIRWEKNIIMGKKIVDDTIEEKLAPQVHEAFSRLSRRLRALDLPDGLTIERLSTLATITSLEPT